MRHILQCLVAVGRHPLIALQGAYEFRGSVGMTYDDPKRSDAYDAGRELAHIATFRRFEPF